METKEQREKRIRGLIEAGISAYNAYLDIDVTTLDDETCKEAYIYIQEYEDIERQMADMIDLYEKFAKVTAKLLLNNVEDCLYIDILRKLEENSAELPELDIETLNYLIAKLLEVDKYQPSLGILEKALTEHTTAEKMATSEATENYTEFLKTIKKKDRKKYLLEDLQTALEIIKSDNKYLNYLERDIKRTDINPYKEIILGDKITTKGETYAKIYFIISLYLYPFTYNYEAMVRFDEPEERIKDQNIICSYADFYLRALTNRQPTAGNNAMANADIFSGTSFVIPRHPFTSALTNVAGSMYRNDDLGLNYVLETERVKVMRKVLDNNNIVRRYGVPTDKLLRVILGEFIKNNTRSLEPKNINTHVVIDLYKYADLTGYSLKEEIKDTHEDQEKEHKRILGRKKELKKNIEANLENISHECIKYNDKVNKEKGSFIILDSYRVDGRKNKIHVVLGQTFSQEMLTSERSQLTQQYTSLLKVDNKNAIAWQIGCKMQTIYNMDRNIRKGKHNKISIEKLLSATSLPSIEDLEKIKQLSKWKERIKEPLEKALDYLYSNKAGINFLKDYRYSHAQGVPLTDEELVDIEGADCAISFEEWKKLYICFEINEPEESSRKCIINASDKRKGKPRKKTEAVKS